MFDCCCKKKRRSNQTSSELIPALKQPRNSIFNKQKLEKFKRNIKNRGEYSSSNMSDEEREKKSINDESSSEEVHNFDNFRRELSRIEFTSSSTRKEVKFSRTLRKGRILKENDYKCIFESIDPVNGELLIVKHYKVG